MGTERPGLCPNKNQWQWLACPGASPSASNTRHEAQGREYNWDRPLFPECHHWF